MTAFGPIHVICGCVSARAAVLASRRSAREPAKPSDHLTTQRYTRVYIFVKWSILRLRAFGQFETIQRRLAWPLH